MRTLGAILFLAATGWGQEPAAPPKPFVPPPPPSVDVFRDQLDKLRRDLPTMRTYQPPAGVEYFIKRAPASPNIDPGILADPQMRRQWVPLPPTPPLPRVTPLPVPAPKPSPAK